MDRMSAWAEVLYKQQEGQQSELTVNGTKV